MTWTVYKDKGLIAETYVFREVDLFVVCSGKALG
jgi:hypothetical protein